MARASWHIVRRYLFMTIACKAMAGNPNSPVVVVNNSALEHLKLDIAGCSRRYDDSIKDSPQQLRGRELGRKPNQRSSHLA
jgi:hypothetical protein